MGGGCWSKLILAITLVHFLQPETVGSSLRILFNLIYGVSRGKMSCKGVKTHLCLRLPGTSCSYANTQLAFSKWLSISSSIPLQFIWHSWHLFWVDNDRVLFFSEGNPLSPDFRSVVCLQFNSLIWSRKVVNSHFVQHFFCCMALSTSVHIPAGNRNCSLQAFKEI